MHIHILGICGTFMGGVAVIAKQSGHRVTGCDADVYPPMSTQLEAQGIELVRGYGAEQLELAPDLWVIGNVVSRGNPLMEAVLDRGDPYVSGPQWITDHVLKSKWVLAVAGTHGKTTTASMLAWLLADAGLNPGFLIGGVPGNFGVSARATESRIFVIEADEYDTAFFDKRSKFVHYRPRTAILNNLEFDHADIFSDLGAIENQFHHFVRTIPRSGLILVNAADAAIERVLIRGCWTPVQRIGDADGWQARDAGSGCFSVLLREREVGTVRWALLGEHNRMNALAAIAAAHHAGVPAGQAIASLARFRGVRRRLELRGIERGVSVYDDFAHHPTAIRATIAGLREKVGSERILAVLEPRSHTMKRGVMKDELAQSLAGAERVYCYCADLAWDARAALAPLGGKAACETDLEVLVAALSREAQDGDHVLIMSNGGFGGIHQKLLAALAKDR
ncbi:MAG: UDP-N-acetylmuramate:L-alanyl-gamma-D-glutamyl-meso-diaminopimelate ligase [Betaproteobacteria bacterium]|nr:UDP-N-acetylmuramate:L-alanyl-gamma-D-glutamyl-meso-diaminopimelate ligase [Betaproteobacteria bacterium]